MLCTKAHKVHTCPLLTLVLSSEKKVDLKPLAEKPVLSGHPRVGGKVITVGNTLLRAGHEGQMVLKEK